MPSSLTLQGVTIEVEPTVDGRARVFINGRDAWPSFWSVRNPATQNEEVAYKRVACWLAAAGIETEGLSLATALHLRAIAAAAGVDV